VRVTAATLRDFRNYAHAHFELGRALTVIVGPNGAGKTNLLEALYFGCTARSPRTSAERELVRRGERVARVTVETEDEEGGHLIEVGLEPGSERVLRVDGAAVDSLSASQARPLLSVFLPERLELVKGAPAARRAHLDSLVAAIWPARAGVRAAYSRALAQRNALLGRIRAGAAARDSLGSWDAELASQGAALMRDRAGTVALVEAPFAQRARELGLPDGARIEYRPRSDATDADGLAAELAGRHAADIDRGFTTHGPHRDEVRLAHGDVALRNYGSQGQQRVAVLALLFAERDVLADQRARPPLMLLDDVMSELDEVRRGLLADLLGSGGQAVVTTTDVDHVAGAGDSSVALLEVGGGQVAVAA
jgi:DNA replication and repair protein RecF